MAEELEIIVDKNFNRLSDYKWMNIEFGKNRVGKARIIPSEERLIINSINIYPEFERNGYARKVINFYKGDYKEIVADRVRASARLFWEKMNFNKQPDGNYIWRNNDDKRT